MTKQPPVLWEPSQKWINNTRLTDFLKWLDSEKQLSFESYHALWKWSVESPSSFWESVWQYFDIKSHTPYTEVLSGEMPDAQWFDGSTLNYAEHIFRSANEAHPAIIFKSEQHAMVEISWADLKQQVARVANWMRQQGVEKGDRVVAFLPNCPEATVSFLAACSLGAIWSSCSPDFGVDSIVDRFKQIEPKILIAADGYLYGGKPFDKMKAVRSLENKLPTLEQIVVVPFLEKDPDISSLSRGINWQTLLSEEQEASLQFTPVPFSHPIWILYSSGTTGIPKAITHSHGGVLLEHLKYLVFHNDVKAGERFFWYSTTGWMMWNFVQAALLAGATIVLYDGSPGYPDINVLWKLAQDAPIHHFGTSAPYLVACMKRGVEPGRDFNLSALRSIGSTGAPLPPEAFDYVYQSIKEDVWLCSMSGGTDVCTAFVGGNPHAPVYEGEIQCRGLGCALYAYNEEGAAVEDEVGEMVITQPMPSMPIYFWNDEGKQRYLSSYFDMFPGIWRHGDWVKITPRNSLVILGRSDATLNRHGVRIGTAEIYRAVMKVKEIKDSLIVNLELSGGRHFMPLFVLMNEGQRLTEAIQKKIKKQLKTDYSPRHVPDEIIEVSDIPYTISGKKLEAPVKKILLGYPITKAANPDSMRNPEALDFFVAYEQVLKKER
jgi:acetoacetyl-CoA synthetase